MNNYNNYVKSKNINKSLAFTLVELIVVITILAILGTIAFISLQGYSASSRDSTRISDMGSIKASLELYRVDSGKYPETTNGTIITYSGGNVWTQGVFGETSFKSTDKLDKIPLDPLSLKEYIYSHTNNNQEYQIAGIYENDTFSYEKDNLNQNIGINKTEAAAKKSISLKIDGSYNGKLLKMSTGSVEYVLSVPCLITSTGATLEYIIANNKLAYNGHKILPYQYESTNYEVAGENPLLLVNLSDLVVYSGSISTLSDKSSTGVTARKDLIKKLQNAYTGTIIKDIGEIRNLLNTDTNNNTDTEIISTAIVSNNLGGDIVAGSVNPSNVISGVVVPSGWSNITTSNTDLPHNLVRGITSDNTGNIWFATYGGGVVKYDGTTMQIFNTGNGFPHNQAKSIIKDSSGNIWVGSRGGLSKFNGTSWTTFDTSNGLVENFVRALDIDSSGNFWLGTGGGLSKFNPTSNTWTSYTNLNSSLPANVINGVKVSTDGNIWIGTYGGGLAKYNPVGNSWTIYTTGNSGLSNNTINGVNQDSTGNIWIGTDGGGISKYNPTGNTWTTYTTPNLPTPDGIYVNASIQDSLSNIWIGSWGGAVKYDQSTFNQYTVVSNNLASNNIYTIFNDINGNIWIGTNGGISVYNPN